MQDNLTYKHPLVVANFLLAIFTGVLALFTYQSVQEMKVNNAVKLRPYVIVQLGTQMPAEKDNKAGSADATDTKEAIYCEIKNVGDVVAYVNALRVTITEGDKTISPSTNAQPFQMFIVPKDKVIRTQPFEKNTFFSMDGSKRSVKLIFELEYKKDREDEKTYTHRIVYDIETENNKAIRENIVKSDIT